MTLDSLVIWSQQVRAEVTSFDAVHERYVRQARGYGELTKLAVSAGALGIGITSIASEGGGVNTAELPAQLREAFALQFPNLARENALSGLTLDEVMDRYGMGLRGKYFEVMVRDTLNQGGAVGSLELQPGQVAVLAESPTQPGWDLRIEPDMSLYQLKATDDLSYVQSTIEDLQGQDIEVITTELSTHVDEISHGLIEAASTSAALDEEIIDALSDAVDDFDVGDLLGPLAVVVSAWSLWSLAKRAHGRWKRGARGMELVSEFAPPIIGRATAAVSPVPLTGLATTEGLRRFFLRFDRRRAYDEACSRMFELISRMQRLGPCVV